LIATADIRYILGWECLAKKERFVKIISLTFYFMVFSAFCITCAYKQCEKVFVYADSTAHRELIHNILDPWNISYADVDSIVDENNEGIYIIVGDVNSMQVHIPAYYFVYQTKSLNKSLSESFKTLASHAVALWDFSNENINTYKV
jgi:hypothetical protein